MLIFNSVTPSGKTPIILPVFGSKDKPSGNSFPFAKVTEYFCPTLVS